MARSIQSAAAPSHQHDTEHNLEERLLRHLHLPRLRLAQVHPSPSCLGAVSIQPPLRSTLRPPSVVVYYCGHDASTERIHSRGSDRSQVRFAKKEVRILYISRFVFIFGLFVVCSSAHAYVDPGSGMLLWQGLIAGVGVGLMFVRRLIEAIKRILNRIRRL